MIKNVIIINDFAHVNGGAGQVALSSAVGLARSGYRVLVFSAVRPIMPELLENGVEVICTGQDEILKNPNRLQAAVQGLWNLKAAHMLSEKLDTCEKTNTVVHVHSWTKALSSSVVRMAIKKDFKVVCTLHDYFTACPNGGFYNYQTNKVCDVRPLSLRCIAQHCDVRSYSQKNWRVARQFIQKSFGLIPGGIRHYICVSDFSLNIIKPYLPSRAKLYSVSNPIESKQEAPVEVSKNTLYVAVGRLSKEKGFLLLAEAARKSGYPVLFIGDGECRRDIQAIHPDAKITGWISRDEVVRYLTQARAIIFPSIWYEAQPLVVLEGASQGIPIIVSDHCAAREMVCDGITGLWFKSGDADDLIKKMHMLQSDNLVSSLGQAAYHGHWTAPFTMERHLVALQEVYQKALTGHP